MKILVPFDFSTESLHALKLAKEMSSNLNLDITIFHSLEFPEFPYNQTKDMEQIKNALTHEAELEIKKVLTKEFDSDNGIEVIVNEANASSGIIKSTYSRDIIYTIIGSKKRMVPEKVGSTTSDIIRFAHGAVINVKHGLNLSAINNILFVTDFSNTPSKLIQNIKLIQSVTKAKITFLYVNTRENWMSTQETIKRKKEFCKVHDLNDTMLQIVNDENLEKGVFNTTKNGLFDLIGIRINLLEGNLDLVDTHLSVERIMDNIDIPVLSYTHRRLFD